MSAHANQDYVRQVLHHTDPPPPIAVRFFYTSPIPIDDPLSPVPPPAAKVSPSLAPKPFSAYDNKALDQAWHELRKKILKYNEEHGEKSSPKEGSRVRADSRALREVQREHVGERRASSSSKAGVSDFPRSSLARQAAANLAQVENAAACGAEDAESVASEEPHQASGEEAAVLPDTTGTPFIRVPSGKRMSDSQRVEQRSGRPKLQQHDTYTWEDASHLVEHSPAPEKRERNTRPATSVPVGVSRLHKVEMPELLMQPIYWTPIQDTAHVVRGTWFYQDTMMPVETAVANMLEAGYIELKVWTQTWKDELDSAVEVGAVGEVKIAHKLWPDKVPKRTDSRPGSRRSTRPRQESLLREATANLLEGAPETPERLREKAVEAACDIIDISTGPGGVDNKAAGVSSYGRGGPPRMYSQYGVIYANEHEARLLPPSLMPSAYYGRRPLANYIRKGHKLGIPLVRGFKQSVWDKLYPTKHSKTAQLAEQGVSTSSSGAPPQTRRKTDPDLAKAERPKVSDLILVIHGIGQKLSQRMESFHFTHAMNAFRRDVNVEVGTPEVKARFRRDMGGVMVLPVNWRHQLSFEEGGYRDGPPEPGSNEFTLADITPETLTSVRAIIADVLSDIPYYLSHHQPKMIAAVIKEANRVYRLWCQNNPGFSEYGRVHIIGHSLGSVLAIDILSRQPTVLPPSLRDPTSLDLDAESIDHFLFQTSNLFLAGSPAGFFILLKKSQLLPRLDHPSATAVADPTSNHLSICGERGQYGCLAVENIYNIVNGYDPVSYRLNATVDAVYAASLKPAYIPSSTASWFGSRHGATWFAVSTTTASTSPAHPPSSTMSSLKPSTLPRLPSNVELETHDFTREEIAEKRMYLLNDNGQIDFFLRYGGGPLEIQYLTMLGAHSSYWSLRDFTRMIVTEVGRPMGREGTGWSMRAVKRKVPLSQ